MKTCPNQQLRERLIKAGFPLKNLDIQGLLEMLPYKIRTSYLHIHKGSDFWQVQYGGDYNVEESYYFKERDKELPDALAMMVLYLRERKLI